MATNTGATTSSMTGSTGSTGSTTGVTAITLVTDNHTGNTNTDQIVLRQSEAGQSLQVTLVHEDGTPYDLTNCLVTFSENKDDGKMVSDDNIQNINAKAGTFTYMFNQAVYQTSGTAWFDITDNTRNLIATTVNFSITITDQLDLPINNNSYWSAAQSLLTHISANISKWQNDIDQSELNTTSQLNNLISQFQGSLAQYSALMNTYDDKFTSLQTSWQNQINSLSEATAAQAATDFKTQRDALEDKFTDFEVQLKKDLSNKLLDLNDALTSLSETTVPQVNESINAVAEEVTDLTSQLNAFDFSQYATHKDLAALSVQIDSMYTNSKIDSMLDAVGKVKSVNGQKPDGSGDVLVAAGKVKTVNGQGPDNNGNISIGTGKVQSVNGNMPNQDGDVQVPSYAPNLLLGTQSKPKTIDMGTWSANADGYSIDPSIDLSGQTVTASLKLAKSTNDTIVVLWYTDSAGTRQFKWGTIVPAGTTGYSTVTQVLPAGTKDIVIISSWTNGTVTGTCTYSEAKLAVWKSAGLPPDMTWVPNVSDVDSDFTADRSRLGKLEGAQTLDSPDFNTITATGVYYITNNNRSNIKNNPVSQWGVLVVSSGNGQRISQVYYPDDGSPQWCRLLNGNNWLPWYQLSTKADVDSKTSGTVVTAYDIASKAPTTVTGSYTSRWLVDQGALGQFADQINQLKGRRTVDAPDFNTLTDSGVYMISNPSNGKNFPSAAAGTLAVFNGNDIRITQLYVGDDGVSTYMRIYGWINGGTAWGSWNQIAWTSDITNLQNQIKAIETGYMKNPTVISQADYNNLATKDPNTLYEITE